MRLACPCSDFPIDGTNIVTGQISAYFLEIQSSPAQPRRMASTQQTGNGMPGQKTEAASFVLKAH